MLLTPDMALLAYLSGPRSYPLRSFTLHRHGGIMTRLALIWIIHIARDRALGYGLKYAGTFNDTQIRQAAAIRSMERPAAI